MYHTGRSNRTPAQFKHSIIVITMNVMMLLTTNFWFVISVLSMNSVKGNPLPIATLVSGLVRYSIVGVSLIEVLCPE